MVDGWDRYENKGSSYTAVPTRISFINIGTPKIIKLYVFMSVNQINLSAYSKHSDILYFLRVCGSKN